MNLQKEKDRSMGELNMPGNTDFIDWSNNDLKLRFNKPLKNVRDIVIDNQKKQKPIDFDDEERDGGDDLLDKVKKPKNHKSRNKSFI